MLIMARLYDVNDQTGTRQMNAITILNLSSFRHTSTLPPAAEPPSTSCR